MRGAIIKSSVGMCLVAGLLPGCAVSEPAQGFAAAGSVFQTYDYSRLTPFPRKTPRPELGQPYQAGADEQGEILKAIAPKMADPASASLVRLQARARPQGAVELCGLAQSQNQTGGDARMVLFAGHLTRAPDGTPHFSLLPETDMFDKVEFCRSRGLV